MGARHGRLVLLLDLSIASDSGGLKSLAVRFYWAMPASKITLRKSTTSYQISWGYHGTIAMYKGYCVASL
jgi:hypothetical protein